MLEVLSSIAVVLIIILFLVLGALHGMDASRRLHRGAAMLVQAQREVTAPLTQPDLEAVDTDTIPFEDDPDPVVQAFAPCVTALDPYKPAELEYSAANVSSVISAVFIIIGLLLALAYLP